MLCPSCNTHNRDDAKFCKGCGQALHAPTAQPLRESQAAPNVAQEAQPDSLRRVSTEVEPLASSKPEVEPVVEPVPEDDPSLAPTLILTPERMMAYHQRRWQDASEEKQGTADPYSSAPSTSIYDEPTVFTAPAHDEHAQVIADLPTFLMPTSDESDVIPIPPPPPPAMPQGEGEEAGEQPSTGVAGGTGDGPYSAAYNGGYADNAGYPQGEMSETVQDSSKHQSLEQAEDATPENSAEQSGATQAASTFPLLEVGGTLQGRYEISQVIADNPHEHVYQVIDHQGYQRCWNCNSEQNAEGDDFCIDCGASLLDTPYIMHEYSTEQSQEDTPTLQGNIVNTIVDENRTYVIEQIQAEQDIFPNGVHLLAASSSDAGNVRRSDPNEDSALILQLQRIHESVPSPVGIYIVADGMGGHDNGQLASRMTINTIAERMTRDLLLAPLLAEKEGTPAKSYDEESLITLLRETIEDANAALCQVNTRDKTDMGSTLTGFMIVGQHAFIVNVGDSRTYMVRGKQLYQLTTDHSLVGQLVASGLIEPDDVYTHPQRSQIYRSLGDKLNTQIDITKQQLHPGDILLSCCDGLWEMVRNPQIESILNGAPDPQIASQQLIDAANANGGEDNITAVIVAVQ